MKRFQPPRPGEKENKIADLEDIGREARAFSVTGVDAALVITDMLSYGFETAELSRNANVLRTSNLDLGMPIARHDLIIDPVQIAEAAVAGAPAVNIIAAAALPKIMELMDAVTAMGIESVVECHTELDRDLRSYEEGCDQ
ncbi:Indole-3-glycerol phosphate synthase [Gracilariopsis chorda]|uniref:indole-3-glycerol-phosphate synthase n=1 Tax=Gracilariopsis chorda TaxID=448386 RepID=A0A2V3IL00_9FLOR|nr:Indole-3-glycerol phosphate synthase [Gracilariopsis chorda]|eukprot:PXF42765.1 Indole-3-glycerol phosphate synthase [Gracilariopsis chorda]